MEIIDFSLNNFGAEGVKVLSCCNHWKGLLYINLSYTWIGPKGAEFLNKAGWNQLEKMILNSARLEDAGVKFLSKCVWPFLQSLKIDDNDISGLGMKELAMNGHWKKLKLLHLNNNKING